MSFFHKLSLKKKLIGGFIFVSLVILIVGIQGVSNIGYTNNHIRNVIQEELPLLVQAEQLQIYALTHRRYEKDFFLNIGKPEKQKGYLNKFEKISKKTEETINSAIELAKANPLVGNEVKDGLNASKSAYLKYVSGFIALTGKVLAVEDITPQEANKLMKPIKEDIYQFENGLKKLVIEAEKIIDSEMVGVVQHGNSSRNIIVTFLIIGFIFSVALSLFISFSIINSVRSVAQGLQDVAQGEGDLTKRLTIQSNDEIGEQAKWFNVFMDKLQDIIKEVSDGVEVLSSSSNELSGVATQLSTNSQDASERSTAVSSATEQMSNNMDTVSAAMEESSNNVRMVAAASEEMTATVSEIAENASKAKNITEGAVKKSLQTTSKMTELGEAANRINKVTEAITEISEQTNLLALNATIEAARAGEVGKGFAVVANEIKELARQTADATVDIKNQIDNMQTTTNATVTDINEISLVINDINEIITTIAVAVEQQSATTSEIAENISQASVGIAEVNENVAQTSVASSEINREIVEISTGSDDINTGSQDVSESAQSLQLLSEKLDQLVGRFKIS